MNLNNIMVFIVINAHVYRLTVFLRVMTHLGIISHFKRFDDVSGAKLCAYFKVFCHIFVHCLFIVVRCFLIKKVCYFVSAISSHLFCSIIRVTVQYYIGPHCSAIDNFSVQYYLIFYKLKLQIFYTDVYYRTIFSCHCV